MSANADMTRRGVQPHLAPETPDLAGRLKHLAISFLPLGLFVGGVLGFEHFSAGSVMRSDASRVPSASRNVTIAAKTAGAKAQAPERQSPAAALSFDDQRDLRGIASAWQADWEGLQPPVNARHSFTLHVEEMVSLPLKLDVETKYTTGTYGSLRGLPASARLSHGIPVSAGTWLIDGADLTKLTFEMRGVRPGVIPLELTIMSSQNRILVREDVSIEFKAAPVPPATAAAKAPVPTIEPPVKFELSLSGEATLTAGRGNLVALQVTPAERLPEGSYVVLRGLPEDAQLSSGLPISPGVWMLSLAEMKSVEVRIPVRANGDIRIDARLATPSGQILADTVQTFRVGAAPSRIAMPSAAAGAAQSGNAQIPATISIGTSLTVPQPVPAIRPTQPKVSAIPAPVPSEPARPEPKSKAAVAEDRVAGNPILSRGRNMLLIGNVAIARPLLERAAADGSGEAAALLGASFDPIWLKQAGVVGIAGEPAKARRWYDEARRLGSRDIERIVAIPQAGRAGVNVR